MWSYINLVTLLAGMCLRVEVLVADDDVGNANDYVDEVLQNLRNDPSMVSKFDPIIIPEVSESKFQLRDGVLHGLSSLYRSGDCSLEYNGDTIKVTGEVAVKDVSVSANYRAKAAFFWIKGDIQAEMDQLSLRLQISATNGKVRLESLKVAHLGDYKIKKITGMSVVLNWLLKIIANSIAKKSSDKIIEALEGPAADALRKELEKLKFPDMLYFRK